MKTATAPLSISSSRFPPRRPFALLYLALSLLALSAQVAATVVIEDAENGDTAGWDVYDSTPAGAAIDNLFDGERGSRVIQLTGTRYLNGFRLRGADGGWWDYRDLNRLRWSQRFDGSFTIFVRVQTAQGTRTLLYRPIDHDRGSAHAHALQFGLGRGARDGEWHDFERDLAADLARFQPTNRLLAVRGILIRGSGRIDDIELGGGDTPTATRVVYVGANATPAETHAAEELVEYVRRATGIEMPIVHRLDTASGAAFIVGQHNAFVDALDDPPDRDALGDDGFELRRIGDHLLIAGATPRGTLYGVYHYLREQLGWEWYSADDPGQRPDDGIVTIPLPSVSEVHVPRFRYREVFSPEGGDMNGDFAARLMLNGQLGHRHQVEVLGERHGWGMDRLDAFDIGTEAGTSPATARRATRALLNALDDPETRPDAAAKAGLSAYAAITHIDGSARSEAPADLAFAAAGDAPGAPLFELTRRVADAIATEHPEITVLGEAYLWSLKPPTNVILPSNAGVAFAPIEADWSQALNAEANQHLFLNGAPDQSIDAYLDDWARHSQHIWMWLYATNFSGYLQPLPNLYPMIDSIRALAERPEVEGLFIQDAFTTPNGSFAALHAWVYARLMWDPTLDGDQLVREFCNGYYGRRAGPIVYRYLRKLRQSAERHPSFIGTKTNVQQPYLNAAFVIQADRLLALAERVTANDPLHHRRVAIERMGIDWVMLLNGPRLEAEAQAHGLTWPDGDENARLARQQRLADTVLNVAGMTALAEGGGEVEDVLRSLRIPRALPDAPVPCVGLAAADCVDVQDLAFELAEADLVGDPEASDGGAAHLPGDTDIWGIQIPFQQWLPETGEWDLYARLRVEPGPGAEDDAAALSLGIDPGDWKRVPLRELRDGRYHTIRVDDLPHGYDGQSYLWFAPPNSDAIEGLYVDRVFAIRRGATPATPDSPCDEAGSPECRVFQDGGLSLYSGILVDGEIRDRYPDPAGGDDLDASLLAAWLPDAGASDGHVAWIDRDDAHWAAQVDLDRLLPASGAWDLYAQVRIGADADAGRPAFRVGVWGGPGNPQREIGSDELSSTEYRLVRLPGGGYQHGDGDAYVWFQTIGASLYIDRLIIVAEGRDPAPYLGLAGSGGGGGSGLDTRAASAFLARATFGPRIEEIQALAASGDPRGWIEDQFTLPPSLHYDWLEQHARAPLDWDGQRDNAHYARLQGWWDIVVNGADQLRQRVAFALSEIFVVSSRGPLSTAPDGLAAYYDVLVDGAFGNFRDLLLNVSRHPMLGRYLSYLGNSRAMNGSHPDENYARELMQLFTIGLVRLHEDGTPVLDADGKPIPTYTQHDIEELARVFTGWSSDDGQFEVEAGWTHESRIHPMVPFEEYHDSGEKQVLGHLIPAGQSTEEDLESAIDILFEHPNTGPFLARRLIQRLVTSNPSPAYVRRVAAAFDDNGNGVRGDLRAVIEAILLDPEALHGADTMADRFGKVREPLLFISNLWRAFHAQPGPQRIGAFHFQGFGLSEHDFLRQQGPLTALTVFNFFTPDDSTLQLAEQGLVAPETKLMGLDELHGLLIEIAHESGEYEVHGMTARLGLDPEIALIQRHDWDALLDRLDVLLLAGHMSEAQHQILRDYLEYKADTPLERRALAQDIVSLVMLSPDYAVQR